MWVYKKIIRVERDIKRTSMWVLLYEDTSGIYETNFIYFYKPFRKQDVRNAIIEMVIGKEKSIIEDEERDDRCKKIKIMEMLSQAQNELGMEVVLRNETKKECELSNSLNCIKKSNRNDNSDKVTVKFTDEDLIILTPYLK